MESVRDMVEAFWSINSDGKSESEYQAILEKVARHLNVRMHQHQAPPFAYLSAFKDDQSEFQNDTLDYLAKTTLPDLKDVLSALLLAMDPSNSERGTKTRYERFWTEDLDDSPKGTGDPGQESTVQPLTFFIARNTVIKVRDLLAGELYRVLVTFVTLLVDFDFTNPPCDRSLTTLSWRNLDRSITLSMDSIDSMIKWVRRPLLDAAKEEWQELVQQIEDSLRLLLKHLNPTNHKFAKLDQSESDDEVMILNPTGMKFLAAIFVEPAMEMEVDRLKLLLQHTHDTEKFIHDFVNKVKDSPSHRRGIVDLTITLIGGFVESIGVLDRYWDSLMASKDPRIDKVAIAVARQWLKDWNSVFLQSTANMMGSTGCIYPWPEPDDEKDTDDAGEFDEYDYDDFEGEEEDDNEAGENNDDGDGDHEEDDDEEVGDEEYGDEEYGDEGDGDEEEGKAEDQDENDRNSVEASADQVKDLPSEGELIPNRSGVKIHKTDVRIW
ncbi:hypothetical protein KEM48_005335 [Puccinia striiformis f. sp. tritici PST-130]|nr:hypothetical protein KEM48_005335 [Puccinia striiformis f. sp. tritici PST-130]